jgi:hypothetical protein
VRRGLASEDEESLDDVEDETRIGIEISEPNEGCRDSGDGKSRDRSGGGSGRVRGMAKAGYISSACTASVLNDANTSSQNESDDGGGASHAVRKVRGAVPGGTVGNGYSFAGEGRIGTRAGQRPGTDGGTKSSDGTEAGLRPGTNGGTR